MNRFPSAALRFAASAVAAAMVLGTLLVAGCGDEGGVSGVREDLRGERYCEILLVFIDGTDIQADVWGTQGLSLCPQASWEALDPDAIQTEHGAQAIVMNGPRHWLIDEVAGTLPDAPPRMFGDLQMRRLASVQLDADALTAGPFTERVVERDTRFSFLEGQEVYELLAPDGSVYVMQSYALIVDPSLTEADLPDLASRITLPAGWEYRVRTLDSTLDVVATGEAVVVQDDLQNTYQRYVDGSAL